MTVAPIELEGTDGANWDDELALGTDEERALAVGPWPPGIRPWNPWPLNSRGVARGGHRGHLPPLFFQSYDVIVYLLPYKYSTGLISSLQSRQ